LYSSCLHTVLPWPSGYLISIRLVMQVASRIFWPVQSVTCHGRMELHALLGQFILVQGETMFTYGSWPWPPGMDTC